MLMCSISVTNRHIGGQIYDNEEQQILEQK